MRLLTSAHSAAVDTFKMSMCICGAGRGVVRSGSGFHVRPDPSVRTDGGKTWAYSGAG
jgi:hypothetical protein